jgi:hypothetical protein
MNRLRTLTVAASAVALALTGCHLFTKANQPLSAGVDSSANCAPNGRPNRGSIS